MPSLSAQFDDGYLACRFNVEAELTDYGVDGSPVIIQYAPEDITCDNLEINGHPVDFNGLPDDAKAAILSLSYEVDLE